jgi:hypothetical protein
MRNDVGSEKRVPASRDDALRALADSWRASAGARYECAGRTTDPTGKHVMNSTAMVYANCFLALTEALGGASPRTSPSPLER